MKWSNNALDEKVGKEGLTYAKEEDLKLLQAIRIACDKRHIQPSTLGTLGKQKIQRGLWEEISGHLLHRSVESVYHRTLNLLDPHKTGLWTQEEVDQLRALCEEHNNDWKKIQELIGRRSSDCYYKYINIIHYDWTVFDNKYDLFTHHEVELLRQELRKQVKIKESKPSFLDISEKVRETKTVIPWRKITKKFSFRLPDVIAKKYYGLVLAEEKKKNYIISLQNESSKSGKNKPAFEGIQKRRCLDVMIIAAEMSTMASNKRKESPVENQKEPKNRKKKKIDQTNAHKEDKAAKKKKKKIEAKNIQKIMIL